MEIKHRKPTGRPRVNEATRELVVRLYAEDKMTCKDIAKACNISESSVFRIMRERRTQNEEKESARS